MATLKRILGWILTVVFISFPVTGIFFMFSLDELITGKDISWDSQESPSFAVVFILGLFIVCVGFVYRFISSSREGIDTPVSVARPPVVPSLNDINQSQGGEGAVISRSEPSGAETPVQKNKRKIIID